VKTKAEKNKKLNRVYQHSTFQRAVSKVLVVAVHTMFHSDMLQIRKRSAPHIKSDFKRDFLFAPNWIEILASSFSKQVTAV